MELMSARILSRPQALGLVSLFLLASAVALPFVVPAVRSAENPTDLSSPAANIVFRLDIRSNDIIFNPHDGLLYVSQPSGMGAGSNSITRINPLTGEIVGSVYVGSEPNKLALSDDGLTLYVALDGAFAIRRYDIATQTPGIQFAIGRGQSVNAQDAPYGASDLAVVPGNPDQVVVSRFSPGISPPGTGVALYHNGVRLPQTGPGHSASSNFVAFGSSSTLYGGGHDGGLRTLTVGANGITDATTPTSFSVRNLKFQNGRIFTWAGQVIDPVSRTLLGTCAGVTTLGFAPDSATGRVLYAQKDGSGAGVTVRACDTTTFQPVGTPLAIPNVGFDLSVTNLVRYGTNGLAMRTSNHRIYFIQTDLIPTENPLPAPSSTPANTPTPTPPVFTKFIRTVLLPNRDLIYRSSEQKFYASVPSAAGTPRANTVTRIDPATGALDNSVVVGSEPGRLAFSDDEQTMYIGINGANAIRRFDMQTQTPGAQFALGSGTNGPLTAYDIKVLPGNSNAVAVSYGSSSYNYDGVHIYENGIRRAQRATASGRVNIASPQILYIGDYYASKYSIVPEGLAQIGTFSTSSSGSESVFLNNRMYTSSGRVLDVASPTYDFVGSYTGVGVRPGLVIDAPNNRIYFLADLSFGIPSWSILAYRLDNFQPVGSIPLPGVTLHFPYPDAPHRLYRWGENGLAFHNNIDKIYFVQSDLIGPNGVVPSAIQLTAATYSSSEATANFPITVTRTGGLTATSTIAYATADGTALAGSDYTATSGTLTFAPGESSKTIEVPVNNDNIFEGNETFSIALSSPGGTGPVELFQPSSATLTIQDNEGIPAVSAAGISISEPRITGTTTGTVTVQLSNATLQTATFNYQTSNGSAVAGSDYIATSGTVTFAPLETTKTIEVQVLADQIYNETNEFFFINFSSPVNAWLMTTSVFVTVVNYNPATARHTPFDFDDDGKSDIGIFRPSVAEWWINRSSNGSTFAAQFGASTDRIVPADYTGDGKADIGIWRPASGEWFVLRSEDFSFYSAPFGADGDVPAPADYDADGKADFAVFRGSSATWFIARSAGGTTIQSFGAAGDLPVAADYDGDRKADLAIFRPSTGEWWLNRSAAGVIAMAFGSSSDKAVQGDYTGDGKADVAFWRPASGEWFVLRSEDFSFYSAPFGASADMPAPGDYDGDGRYDFTVFRPSNATWFSQRSTAGTLIQQFGAADDAPLANAFVR